MKKLVLTFVVVILASCGGKKEEEPFGKKQEEPVSVSEETAAVNPMLEKGKEIFEGKGTCATCHKPDVKVVGPSIKDIAKIYRDNSASIASFINGEGEPLVDPSQYEIMKANFVITKAMSADERKALEEYMMSVQ